MRLKNQADNLLFSYESTLRDNRNLLNEQLINLANIQVDQLEMVMKNSNISLTQLKTLLEEFQQSLFAIGTDIYERTDKGK